MALATGLAAVFLFGFALGFYVGQIRQKHRANMLNREWLSGYYRRGG